MRARAVAFALVLGGCGALPRHEAPPPAGPPPTERRPGAYYLDDGPHERVPVELAAVPDAVPRREPLHRHANRPYVVMGRLYVPMAELRPWREQGVASWYGRRYHGQRTSSGEPYDMYAMTAAHPTLPIPSYARVTNLANGRSVVVRVNDRGPFLGGRAIDLSFVAAWKLGFVEAGTAPVLIEALVAEAAGTGPLAAAAAVATTEATPPSGAETVRGPGGVYLQLGAFSAAENAESFRARLALELSWLDAQLAVVAGDGLHRVQAGPFADAVEARAASERIRVELGIRPIVR